MAACVGIAPVPRYPWVEDRGLALAEETLVIEAREGGMIVDALFRFEPAGAWQDQAMFFPIGGPGGPAEWFEVTLEGNGEAPLRVASWESGGLDLPAGDAVETRDVTISARDLAAHGGVVRVRYEQPCEGSCGYVLRSGSYWSGPMATLEVEVRDPEGAVLSALVEGEAPHSVEEGVMAWTFEGLEPRGGVVICMRDEVKE